MSPWSGWCVTLGTLAVIMSSANVVPSATAQQYTGHCPHCHHHSPHYPDTRHTPPTVAPAGPAAQPSTEALPVSACVCPLLLRCEIVFENARTPSQQCCMYSLLFYFGCGVHNQFTVDHVAPADADVPHQLCILQCASFDWHGHNFYGCNKQFCLSPIFYGIILLFYTFCNFL